ncbi:amidohydrolase family protein [Microbacterium sp. Sa4CUA7]|uniref:Amidohydrolase family protein n=1 Tax=Microbacterium pullorum TaxID=2762236 RepID=A0ABR8S2J1_9MICO|nr:amidohydrolase family protein [Microbacterium pullorum]MBD7957712.1 amidohydrolase family protein [Microbacterium pullorum]
MPVAVIDAHVHIWDPAVLPVPWVEGSPLAGPRLPRDLDGDDRISARVFVEADMAATPLAEVDWATSLGWDGLIGIVADVDLTAGTLPSDLAELRLRPLVRGVRDLLQNRTDAAIAACAPGLGLLGDVTFDACVTWQQLPAVAALATVAPETAIVLDHCGKPPVTDGLDSAAGKRWLRGIRSVAACDNVTVKLSGLRAEAADAASFTAHAPAFLEATLEAFGTERAMFGSDWPVSTGADAGVSTAQWIDLVRVAAGTGWPQVAAGTASRVYRLRG